MLQLAFSVFTMVGVSKFNITNELPVYTDYIYAAGLLIVYSNEFLSIVHAVGLVVYEVY